LASGNLGLAFSLGKSSDIFLLLGNYLFQKKLINCSPTHFAHSRIEASITALDKANKINTSLNHIYKELAYILHLSNEESDKIMTLEKKLEWMLLKNIPQEFLPSGNEMQENQFLKDEIKKIKTIHDHHSLGAFGNKDIRNDSSFLSDFEKENKHNGSGNLQAVEEGILEIKSSRFEKILEDFIWETGGLSSAMAGASKIARITYKVDSLQEKVLRDIASGLIAPTLVSYVLWVLKRANILNLKKLIFFNNNGQLLFQVAEILKLRLKIEVELKLISSIENIKDIDIQNEPETSILEKEKLDKSDKYAIVTINNNHQELNKILIKDHLKVFYFSLEDKNSRENHEGYIYDVAKDIGYKSIYSNVPRLIEAFFLPQMEMENAGTSQGNGRKDSIAVHRSFPDHEEKLVSKCVLHFTNKIFLASPFVYPYTDMRATISGLLKAFLRKPSSNEAKVWSNFLSTVYSFGKPLNFAAPYQVKDVYTILTNGIDLQSNGRWKEGSLSVTPRPLKKLIELSSKIGSRIHKLRKRIKI
jgi:hypothetical protein